MERWHNFQSARLNKVSPSCIESKHNCNTGKKIFRTNRYSNGCELCSTTCRFVSTRLWGIAFLQGLLKTFNSSFRDTDDVLSLSNSRFCDYLHLIYPNELEVKDTTDTRKYASCLHIEINNGWRLKTKIYDKRDIFTFPIVNFPFISSNITASPAYGVSQLIRYSRACARNIDFLNRTQLRFS